MVPEQAMVMQLPVQLQNSELMDSSSFLLSNLTDEGNHLEKKMCNFLMLSAL